MCLCLFARPHPLRERLPLALPPAALDAELGIDAVDILFDRSLGQIHPLRDLPVAQPLRNEFGQLTLPRGQRAVRFSAPVPQRGDARFHRRAVRPDLPQERAVRREAVQNRGNSLRTA